MAGFGGPDAKGDCQMRLADARRPEENDIAAIVKEAQRRQLVDEALVDRGLLLEIEVLEPLRIRETCELQTEPHCSLVPMPQLAVEQIAEEMGVRPLLCGGLLRHLVELRMGDFEPELLKSVRRLLLVRDTHRPTS